MPSSKTKNKHSSKLSSRCHFVETSELWYIITCGLQYYTHTHTHKSKQHRGQVAQHRWFINPAYTQLLYISLLRSQNLINAQDYNKIKINKLIYVKSFILQQADDSQLLGIHRSWSIIAMINPHHVGLSKDYPNLLVEVKTRWIRQCSARAAQNI